MLKPAALAALFEGGTAFPAVARMVEIGVVGQSYSDAGFGLLRISAFAPPAGSVGRIVQIRVFGHTDLDAILIDLPVPAQALEIRSRHVEIPVSGHANPDAPVFALSVPAIAGPAIAV